MSKLIKISEVLALKRSRAERDVASSQISLKTVDRKIETMKAKISEMNANVYSGANSDDPIGDVVMLDQWRDMTFGKIRELKIQKQNISKRLILEKELLKKNIIKQDVVNKALEAKRRIDQQAYFEGESSSRLENWVLAKSY